MNYENEASYRQVMDERENLFGWFKTPPNPSPEHSDEMIVLVTRALAREQEREKQRKRKRKLASLASQGIRRKALERALTRLRFECDHFLAIASALHCEVERYELIVPDNEPDPIRTHP